MASVDLATLVLALDSTQMVQGKAALDAVVPAAQRVADAANKVEINFLSVNNTIERTASATQRLAREMDAAQRIMQGMSAVGGPALQNMMASQNMIAGMSAMGAAAQTNFGRVSSGAQMAGRDMGLFAMQMQDVGISLAMGMNPGMVALQQGTQIAGQFMMMGVGLRAALPMMGAGIMAFLTNPLTLAVAGLSALGFALPLAFSWFNGGEPKKIEDILKSHRLAVDALTSSYGGARTAVSDLGRESERVLAARMGVSSRMGWRSLGSAANELAAENLAQGSNPLLGLIPERLRVNQGAFDPKRLSEGGVAAMEEFRTSIRAGRADFLSLAEGIVTALDNPDITRAQRKTLEGILQQTEALIPQQMELERVLTLHNRIAAAAGQSRAGELRDMGPQEVLSSRDRAQRIYQQRRNAAGAAGSPRAVFGIMSSADRDYAAALGEISRQESLLKQEYDAQLRAIVARTDAQRVGVVYEQATNAALRDGVILAAEALDIERQTNLERQRLDFQFSESKRMRREGSEADLEDMRSEFRLVGQSVGEVARLRTEFQLWADTKRAARATGRAITPEDIQFIRDASTEMGRLTQALTEYQLQQELLDQRRMMSLQGIERDVAERLLGAGLPLDSPVAEQVRYNAELERTVENMDLVRSTAKGALSGFVSDLQQGATFAEALRNALLRIFDTIANRAIDSLVDAVLGGEGTSGGGILGDWLFGVAGGRRGAPPASLTAPAMSTGYMEVMAATVIVNGPGFGGGAGGGVLPAGVSGPASGSFRAAQEAGMSALAGGATTSGMEGIHDQVYQFFRSKGLSNEAVAGIMGNISQESGFDPTIAGDDGAAHGLFQWNDRAPNLFRFIGGRQNLSDVQKQLEFAWHELQTTEGAALKALQRSGLSPEEHARMFSNLFERPSALHANIPGRQASARRYFDMFGTNGGLSINPTVAATDGAQLAQQLQPAFQEIAQGVQGVGQNFLGSFGGALQGIPDMLQGLTGIGGGATGAMIPPLVGGLFHGGGVAGTHNALVWANDNVLATAPRYHAGRRRGLALNEEVAVLTRDEEVTPSGRMRRDGALARPITGPGQGGVNLVVNNYSRAEVGEARQGRNAAGEPTLEMTIRDQTRETMRDYNVKKRPRRRQ